MNCMRNYVQQEANCIAITCKEKKKRFSFKSFISFVIFMHFETALQETQS